jgi:hypothetical protein
MATPRLTCDQISQVSGLVAGYISAQREMYAPRSVSLSVPQRAPLKPFFSLRGSRKYLAWSCSGASVFPILSSTRCCACLGFMNLPDPSTMAAITFCNVVVSHEPFSDGLFFHKLVHAEQYRQFGIPRFADLYVRGFLNGGSYEAIRLEVNAYSLEDRFWRDPRWRFSEQAEVAKWSAEGRL